MNTLLSEIVTLQSGLYAKPRSEGDVLYLQVRHFTKDGNIDNQVGPYLELDNKIAKSLLREKDILFATKGERNFAAVYERRMGSAIASTSFLVISLKPDSLDRILPEYICWFINHPRTQKHLKSIAKGTFIQSISMSVLADLEISVPDFEKQHLILKIAELRRRISQLNNEIESLRDNLIQHKLITSTQQ